MTKNGNRMILAGFWLATSAVSMADPGSDLLKKVSSDSFVKNTVSAMAERLWIQCDEASPVLVASGTSLNDSTFEVRYKCDFTNTLSVSGYIEDSTVQVSEFVLNKK